MLDEYFADPADETQDASGDTQSLQDSQTQDADDTLFLSPVLDRIRTSD